MPSVVLMAKKNEADLLAYQLMERDNPILYQLRRQAPPWWIHIERAGRTS